MDRLARPLSDAERLDWRRLIRIESIGPVSFGQIVARFGDARSALDALPDLASRGGHGTMLRPCPRDAAEREIEALTRIGARLVASL